MSTPARRRKTGRLLLNLVLALGAGTGIGSTRTVPTLIEKLNTTHRSGSGDALATDGVRLLVGSTGAATASEVQVYKQNAGSDSFVFSGVIVPSAGLAGTVSRFGRAVAIDDSIAAVSAIESGQGAVYIYVPDPFALGNWILVKALYNINTDWGKKLDLSGMLLAIGENSGDVGRIHIHRATQGGSNNWGFVKRLNAPSPPGGVLSPDDNFGIEFDLNGSRLIASMSDLEIPGVAGKERTSEVYVFEANTGGADQWGIQRTFLPANVGASFLGPAVAMEGNRLVFSGVNAGSGRRQVWFFDAGGSTWTEASTFEIPAGVSPLPAHSFGSDLALSWNDAIASYYDRFTTPDLRHVATVFKRTGATWSLIRVRVAGVLLDDAYGAEESHVARAQSRAALVMRNGVLAFNALKGVGSETTRSGLVNVRVRNAGGTDNWGEVNEFRPLPGWQPQFGAAMAAAGNYLVVGDPGDDEVATDSGAVFWFERQARRGTVEWKLLKKIKPATPQAGARFGASVDIHVGSFTHIVIGAPGITGGGGAYRYAVGSGVASPGLVGPFAISTRSTGDEAGAAVAVSDRFVAVGSPNDGDGVTGNPGSVIVYVRVGTGALTSSGLLQATGTIDTGDRFGASLSLWGDYLAVGAPNDEGGGTVHVYEYDSMAATPWTLVRQISLGTGALAQFGKSLDLDGGFLAVGAPGLFSGQGQAYLYLKESYTGSPSGWGLISTILAPSTTARPISSGRGPTKTGWARRISM